MKNDEQFSVEDNLYEYIKFFKELEGLRENKLHIKLLNLQEKNNVRYYIVDSVDKEDVNDMGNMKSKSKE